MAQKSFDHRLVATTQAPLCCLFLATKSQEGGSIYKNGWFMKLCVRRHLSRTISLLINTLWIANFPSIYLTLVAMSYSTCMDNCQELKSIRHKTTMQLLISLNVDYLIQILGALVSFDSAFQSPKCMTLLDFSHSSLFTICFCSVDMKSVTRPRNA